MEGVLASGLTPGHGGHRAQPCPGVLGLGLFLEPPPDRSARGGTVALGHRGAVCACVSWRVCQPRDHFADPCPL